MKIFSKGIIWSLAAIHLVPAIIGLTWGWAPWEGLAMVFLCRVLQVFTAILFLPLLKNMPQRLLRRGKVCYIGLALFFVMLIALIFRTPRIVEAVIYYPIVALTPVLYVIMLTWTILLGAAKEERI